MKRFLLWVMVVTVIILSVSLGCPAQSQEAYEPEPAGNVSALNTETDIATETGSMIYTSRDSYTVTLKGVSMRKAVDLLVDNSIRSKVPVQTFDTFTIRYDGTQYKLSDRDEDYFTSTSISEIKKELKRMVKLVLDNL